MATLPPGISSRSSEAVFDVGEVIRRFGEAFRDRYGARLTPHHRKVLQALAACRTPAVGTRIYRCDHCGQTVPLSNSCCDRHCPTCQAGERADWLDQRHPHLHVIVPGGGLSADGSRWIACPAVSSCRSGC